MDKRVVATMADIALMLLISPVQAQKQKFEQKKGASILGLNRGDGPMYSVEEAMSTHGIKGLSVAVFEN